MNSNHKLLSHFLFVITLSISSAVQAEDHQAQILSDYLFEDSLGQYHLTTEGGTLEYDSFSIADGILTLKDGSKGQLSFAIKTDLTTKDLEGTWFEYTKNSYVEATTKITRRETNYDFEYVELYHEDKKFATTTRDNLGVEYQIIDGALIYEGYDYVYFVLSASPNAIQYVGSDGDTFLETKYQGESFLDVPQNYERLEE